MSKFKDGSRLPDPFKMAVLQNLYCFSKHEFDEDTVKYAKKAFDRHEYVQRPNIIAYMDMLVMQE